MTGRVRVLRKKKCEKGGVMEATPTYSNARKQQRAPNSNNKPATSTEKEDNCCPVTVETTVCNAEGTSLINHLQINLLSHCILCLRKTTSSRNLPPTSSSQKNAEPSERLQAVPRAEPSTPLDLSLSCFNRVWSYLGKRKEETETDALFLLESGDEDKSAVFLELPTMCISCAEKMEAIHRLILELRSQLDVLSRVKLESRHGKKYSWRADQFQTTLRCSNLEVDVIDATHKILGIDGRTDVHQEHFTVPDPTSISENQSTPLPMLEEIALSVMLKKELEDMQTKHCDETGSDYDGVSGGDQDICGDSGTEYIKTEPVSDFSEDEPSDSDFSPSKRRLGTKRRRKKLDRSGGQGGASSTKKILKKNSIPGSITKKVKAKKVQRKEKAMEAEPKKDKPISSEPKLGAGRSEYKCSLCDATFLSEKGLRSHKIRAHGAEPYKCKLCSATFSYTGPLRQHEREHAGELERFPCDVEGCGKMFKTKKTLETHHSAVHLRLKHVCELCGKSYADHRGLVYHKNAVHLGLRPFACKFCGDSFSRGSLLRQHVLIHTGERPHMCEICSQRFRGKHALKTHLESHRQKGDAFKPNGPMKHIRKRVAKKVSTDMP